MKYDTLGSNGRLVRNSEDTPGFPKLCFSKKILRVVRKRCWVTEM